MGKKVKKGMSAKEIATLHYQLAMNNEYDEWLKTLEKFHRDRAESRGSKPQLYWKTARRYVDELGYSYKFKEKVDRQSDDDHIKFFFHRLSKEGKAQGTGQVPIHVVKDEDENNEWRVDITSW
ncbi:MAG: hypothetical protein U9O98_10465 [Asgard group archaeon]|nr:hypothetical protein [Asgard group archaeon]